ncbi:VOC family protein [Amycolatopsis sp. lyj-112]|uniref:VOC family protein n=1 Tax=Amycolatopsis sp. lyj-112 TaxID=2789288 RepID=UPI00397D02F4
MRTRILAVTVDCREAEALAAFWKEALGYPETERWTDSHGLTYLELKSPETTSLLFQQVPEEKSGKNRLHLDIAPTELEQREEVARLVSLGAKVVADSDDDPWVVMTDPEGNEFCVLPRR